MLHLPWFAYMRVPRSCNLYAVFLSLMCFLKPPLLEMRLRSKHIIPVSVWKLKKKGLLAEKKKKKSLKGCYEHTYGFKTQKKKKKLEFFYYYFAFVEDAINPWFLSGWPWENHSITCPYQKGALYQRITVVTPLNYAVILWDDALQ